MNEFLAELYGTNEIINDEPDLEKTAAEEFLVKLAAEEGVDLDDLSDEQIGELLEGIEGEMGKQASAETDVEDEAQEKLAEADFMGRAMAHAYVNELAEIEKQAGLASHLSNVVKEKGVGEAIKELGRSQKQALVSGARSGKALVTGKLPDKAAKRGGKYLGVGIKRRKDEGVRGMALRALGRSAQTAAPTLAAGTAGIGAAGYGLSSMGKNKKASDEDFEQLAQQRAYEMLEEAGYDVEKQAEADTAAAIDARALEMLEAAGYPVE